jgi:hypothetical protein
MTTPTDQEEIVFGILEWLARLDRVHYILTPSVSESLRDLADKIDHGSGDKLQFRLARRKWN